MPLDLRKLPLRTLAERKRAGERTEARPIGGSISGEANGNIFKISYSRQEKTAVAETGGILPHSVGAIAQARAYL
jgi:hypothetical protein